MEALSSRILTLPPCIVLDRISSYSQPSCRGRQEVFIRSQVPAQFCGPREEWSLVFANPTEHHKAGLLSHYQPQLTCPWCPPPVWSPDVQAGGFLRELVIQSPHLRPVSLKQVACMSSFAFCQQGFRHAEPASRPESICQPLCPLTKRNWLFVMRPRV